MEEAAIPTRKARWWHSRRRRQQLLVPAYLALVAVFIWGPDDRTERLLAWSGIFAIAVAEWLWFRFLDPNYPADDSRRISERSFVPPDDQAWWQSRYRRRRVLNFALVSLGVPIVVWNDWDAVLAGVSGMATYYVVDWVWFRFFDPDYPEDDLDRDPVPELDDGDDFSFIFFGISVLAVALFLWVMFGTFLAG